MTRSPGVLLLLIGALLGLSSLPSGAQAPERSVLDGVPALDRPVTYSEARVSLGEVVRRVAAETGALLAAAKEVADEPVTVAVQALPARDLLLGLAELLDYQWRHVGEAGARKYEIYQDLASRKREEDLRRSLSADLEKRLEAEIASVVELAALPQAELDELIREGEERSRALQELSPAQRQSALSSPAHQRSTRARLVWSPINRALAKLVARLPQDHWAMLRTGEVLTLSSQPGPGEAPLPQETLRALSESDFRFRPPRDLSPVPDPTGRRLDAEGFARREQQSRDRWKAASGFQVMLWIDAEESDTLRLIVSAHPLQDGLPIQEFSVGQNGSLHVQVSTYSSKMEQVASEQTAERAGKLAADPLLNAVKPFRASQALLERGYQAQLPDYLPEISRAYQVPILSDAYSGSILVRPLSTAEPVALWTLLDRLSGSHHRWEQRGGQIRVRQRTWFLSRGREVPLRLVRRWQESFARRGALTWAEVKEVRSTLTRAQRRSMGELFLERHHFPVGFTGYASNHASQLYPSLSAAQRQRLSRGGSLPITMLTPTQRSLFFGKLRETIHYNLRYQLAPVPVRALAEASFSVRSERLLRTREQRGEQVHYRDQPASDMAPLREGQYRVTRYTFIYRYAPQLTRTEEMTVAADS